MTCSLLFPGVTRVRAAELGALVAALGVVLGACGNNGDTPVDPGDSEPTTGAVSVDLATTGDTLDQDGYTVTLDGSSQSVAVDGSVLFSGLSEGSYTAELSGVQSNCNPSSEPTRSVSVAAGDTTTAQFDVSCAPALFNRIVYSSDRDGTFDIYVMNADGSGRTRLTSHDSLDAVADVSPDGTRILFVSRRDGNRELYMMDADGTNLRRLTNNSVVEDRGEWSPDGSRIAFASGRDGDLEIYLMDPDGTITAQLTENSADDAAPRWSSSGDEIIFASHRDGGGTTGEAAFELYKMNADGSNHPPYPGHV